MSFIKSFNDITNIYYINLEQRIDRKINVEKQLNNIGFKSFQRFNAIQMKDGAIGCSMSHLKILENAIKNDLDHVLILEDDILFLDPELFKQQFNKFVSLGLKWDVILFAGNNKPPHEVIHDCAIKVRHCLTTTGYLVNKHYMKILALNIRSGLKHLIEKPDMRFHFAIDKFWIVLQENGEWFFITPPTVVQSEGYSDIEKKVTNYSERMLDLDKLNMFQTIQLNNSNQINKIITK